MKHIISIIALAAAIPCAGQIDTSTFNTPAPIVCPKKCKVVLLSQRAAAKHQPTPYDAEVAVENVRQQEVLVYRSGHPERFVAEDLANIQSVVRKQDEDAAAAKAASAKAAQKITDEAIRADKEREAAMAANHCNGEIEIGTTEQCVYAVLGRPDHTNEDARSGKQLVYPNYKYIYIDKNGFVEDIQKSY